MEVGRLLNTYNKESVNAEQHEKVSKKKPFCLEAYQSEISFGQYKRAAICIISNNVALTLVDNSQWSLSRPAHPRSIFSHGGFLSRITRYSQRSRHLLKP